MAEHKDPEEEDKVAAAYENISKKLDSIRNGGDDDEEDEAEEKEAEKSEDKIEDEEESEPGKKWKPAKNDPLDEEAESDDEKEKDIEEDDSAHSNIKRPDEFEETRKVSDLPAGEAGFSERQPQPDTLDDLTEEEEFDIPNLKGSRQEGSNIGYNAPPEKSSMDNNDPNNFFSQANLQQPPKRANKFHLLVLVLIGVAVIGFTVYILKGGFGEINIANNPSPSPSAVESPSPTPTPTPEPDRAQITIRILNGSGKTGLAASVSAKLKELGYQVEKTGNATNSAFTQTIVRVKPDNESIIAQIIKDLTPDFDSAGNTSLKDDDTVDIEIILGAK